MPGYATWKNLYKEEYFQLKEEGYPVDDFIEVSKEKEQLPFPKDLVEQEKEAYEEEALWEKRYYQLWKVTEGGIRKDFPYEEPDSLDEIYQSAALDQQYEMLSYKEYLERLKGAWFGRCSAVILGKPLEMGYDRKMVRKYLESVDAYPLEYFVPEKSEKLDIVLRTDCIPSTRGNVHYVQPDDDINYTISSLLLAEEKGLDFTKLDVGMNLLDHIPYNWLWVADNQCYYHMVNLTADRPKEEQVEEFARKLNPWRECMDGQLKADFWGYICPGDPKNASEFIYRKSSFSLVKNGIYGGMFIAGCISAAMSRNPTVDKILKGGLSVIPQKSRLYEAVTNVMKWYEQYGHDWIKTADKIYEVYGHWYFAATLNNLSFVTLALLHGQLDYSKTITTAVMIGTDTDCNSATSGSIVGAAIGFDAIDKKWTAPLNNTVQSTVAGFRYGTITDLVERTSKFVKLV